MLQTPPVGFEGELIIIPFVFFDMIVSRCVKSISKLFSGIVLTKTGSASANRTNSGKETQ